MLVHVCEWSELMLSHRPWRERLDCQSRNLSLFPTQVSIDGKSVTASGRSLARAHSRQPSIDLHPASKRDLATVSSSDDDSAERVRRSALEPCFLSWSPGSQRERHNSPQCLPRAWCACASTNAQRETFSTATAMPFYSTCAVKCMKVAVAPPMAALLPTLSLTSGQTL